MKRSKILVGALVALLVVSGLFLADTAKAQDTASTTAVKATKTKWRYARYVFQLPADAVMPADLREAIVRLTISPESSRTPGKAAPAFPVQEIDVVVGPAELGLGKASVQLLPAPARGKKPKAVMMMRGVWANDGTPAIATQTVSVSDTGAPIIVIVPARGTVTDPNDPPPDPNATAIVHLTREEQLGDYPVATKITLTRKDFPPFTVTTITKFPNGPDDIVVRLVPGEYRVEVSYPGGGIGILGFGCVEGENPPIAYAYR